MPPSISPTRIPDATAWHFCLWLLRRLKRYRVRGESMRPGLKPGDVVLVNPRAYDRERPAVGDVVVADHPFRKDTWLIKRITDIESDGRLHLQGDNPTESTDSRALGPLSPGNIMGRVRAVARG